MILEPSDQAMLAGDAGPAAAMAMKIIVGLAEITGAVGLLDVAGAHVDGCLHHGLAGVEFAERLRNADGTVRVPTTLNVSSVDLLHPDLYRGDDATRAEAKRLMDAYVDMGCEPTWTCAPYQLASRPEVGENIAWAESNAIIFANSVLGARTGRYGDFVDIAAAITGRVPASGLHLDENRRATVVVDVSDLPPRLLDHDAVYPVLGFLLGRFANGVPALVGVPEDVSEDQLKAMGAAAAASGALAMFHVVGVTPEAATLEMALGGRRPQQTLRFTAEMIADGRDELSTTRNGRLSGVSMGTPHYSASELRHLVDVIDGRRVASEVDCYVSTSRAVLAEVEEEGIPGLLADAGVEIVVDTCTYITPIIRELGVVMTDSAKWAYYAPGNIGVDVVFGSVADCVESAIAGDITRDERIWARG